MKKITIKAPIYPRYRDFIELFDLLEVVQIHHLDGHQVSVTQKAKFKDPDMNPKLLEGMSYGMRYIETLGFNEKKNQYIYFSEHELSQEIQDLFNYLDISIEPPIIFDHDYLLISFITDFSNIDEIFDSKAAKTYNEELKILSISQACPNNKNLFLMLSDRQKEIMFYAVQHGYYETPRKINSKAIAEHFSISRSAVHGHLRRIESTIFNSIFK